MPDIPGNSSTTATIAVGGSVSDTLEVIGDHDWFRIELVAGQKITIKVNGITLEDSYVYVRDAAGNLLAENDDISSGVVRDSRLVFTATTTGTYYIDVGAFDEAYAGTYQLSVEVYTPPPIATITQIADHLASGYWGGDSHHFNVTQGGSISVNITGLTAAGQTLARAALTTWSDIIGISFNEVTTGGQITFDDNAEGAFSDGSWSGGIISSAHVNVSTQWLTDYGTSLNGYSFQTYIHEIGHALGLGHGGFYNSTANYDSDALFANDGWPLTIMSYFDQQDSSYFSNLGFSFNYIVTPALADIAAISLLYGLSTTTRVGDTIYGPSWTSSTGALTIFDSGGNDTIDVSGLGGSHLINLTPGTFSNILGEVGNVSIALGVIIENAIGGSNGDLVIGNSSNNVLNGGGNIDTVSYETATAGVTVNLSLATAQNTVNAGTDTILNFENLTGSGFNDVLTGRGLGTVNGGDGNDVIRGSIGGDRLNGDGGDDIFVPGSGFDTIDGGAGWDTVDFSGAASGAVVDLGNQGPNGSALFQSVEQAIGSALNDQLTGESGTNILVGLAGTDTLTGGLGVDTLTGGLGADTFRDTAAGLNGDTITDLTAGDKIVITNATLAGFTFNLSGSTLTFTGGSLTLSGGVSGQLVASAAASGGVQLTLQAPANDPRNDFNGDGRSDLLLRHTDGTLTDWLGLPNGGFAANDAVAVYALSNSWQVNATGDFNGDGRDDLLLRHTDGTLTDWLGQTNGSFVSNHAALAYGLDNAWQVDVTGDFNGDGRDDLLLRHTDGTLTDWLGLSNGGFAANDAVAVYALSNSWQVEGAGDFNGDGRDDLLLRHTDGTLTDWLGQANGSFVSNHAALAYGLDNAWQVAGTGDFNGDGRDDLLLRHTDGTLTDWLGQANGGFASNHENAVYALSNSWQVDAIGDYNGDGRDDLLLRHTNGTLTDWLGQANGSFVSNDGALAYGLDNAWQVQPDLSIL